ncbi:hypothetical protein BE11_36650 [Sorangium cellulosum]|nr:hypothetical protein BE11_36650 [Sorangium cellulosum]
MLRAAQEILRRAAHVVSPGLLPLRRGRRRREVSDLSADARELFPELVKRALLPVERLSLLLDPVLQDLEPHRIGRAAPVR